MIRFVLPFALLAAACTGSSAGSSGQDESKTYDVQGFTRITASAGVIISLKEGPFAVSAHSHNADLSQLRIELRGEELNVSRQGFLSLGKSPTYNVDITAPKIAALETVAGAQITADSLNLSDIKLSASAGGILNLSGTCWTAAIDATAGGIIHAADLKCQTANAKSVAGGIIDITATDKADLSADAGGIINISGNPASITQNAAVGGVITKK